MHYQYLPETENERTFNKYQTGAIKIFPIQIITNQQGKVYYIKKGNTKNIKHKLSKRIDKILSTSSGPGSLYSQRKTKESYSTEKIWNLPIAKEEVK